MLISPPAELEGWRRAGGWALPVSPLPPPPRGMRPFGPTARRPPAPPPADVFATFKDLLTRHKPLVAQFLAENYGEVRRARGRCLLSVLPACQ